jgi:transposase
MTTKTMNITAKTSADELPNDLETLRRMVLLLLANIDELAHEKLNLQNQLENMKRRLFGRRSEKLDENQLLLFAELLQQMQNPSMVSPPSMPEIIPDSKSHETKKPRPKPTGRKPLPKDLPRKRTEILPPMEERHCAIHDCDKKRIGEEVTEELEFIPASFYVHEIVRPKFACELCESNISIAELPARPIDKGLAGPGLLAYILTSKYADHLPLNRLEGIIARSGVDIARSTMCQWVAACSDLLTPIVNEMKKHVLESKKIHTDDTYVPVQDEARSQTKKSYLWTYIGDLKDVVFDFTPTRAREGPVSFLGNYHGYLQADAYNGYDTVFEDQTIIEVGCWAHTRRKFDEAFATDRSRCAEMLSLIHQLYEVEREAAEKSLDASRIFFLRLNKSRPILKRIKETLDAWSPVVLPKSPLGQAVGYALRQWEALTRYVENAILSIDNNLSERTLRTVAIGRKNWLFAGSDEGGKRAAIIYSLVASCKLLEMDPFAYFRDVLDRVSTHPNDRIFELTPRGWKAALTSSPCTPK